MRNSMFGNTLEEVMDLQKNQFSYRKLPWIQVTLSQQVIESFLHLISTRLNILFGSIQGSTVEWNPNRGYFPCVS